MANIVPDFIYFFIILTMKCFARYSFIILWYIMISLLIMYIVLQLDWLWVLYEGLYEMVGWPSLTERRNKHQCLFVFKTLIMKHSSYLSGLLYWYRQISLPLTPGMSLNTFLNLSLFPLLLYLIYDYTLRFYMSSCLCLCCFIVCSHGVTVNVGNISTSWAQIKVWMNEWINEWMILQ